MPTAGTVWTSGASTVNGKDRAWALRHHVRRLVTERAQIQAHLAARRTRPS